MTALTPDYQRILGVVEERSSVGKGPLKAKEIAVELGLETTPAKVEGVRSKARRLAERGWLRLGQRVAVDGIRHGVGVSVGPGDFQLSCPRVAVA